MINVKELVNKQKDLIINTRRDLHRIPETAYTEKKTAAYVTDYLNREGLEVQTGIARLGVVGLMKTRKVGPTLMIRADMDALPLSEATGLAFSTPSAWAGKAVLPFITLSSILTRIFFYSALKPTAGSGWIYSPETAADSKHF